MANESRILPTIKRASFPYNVVNKYCPDRAGLKFQPTSGPRNTKVFNNLQLLARDDIPFYKIVVNIVRIVHNAMRYNRGKSVLFYSDKGKVS